MFPAFVQKGMAKESFFNNTFWQKFYFLFFLSWLPRVLLPFNDTTTLKFFALSSVVDILTIFLILAIINAIVVHQLLRKIIYFIAASYFALFGLFDLLHIINFGSVFRPDSFHVIFETSLKEVLEVVGAYANFKNFAAILLFFAVSFFASKVADLNHVKTLSIVFIFLSFSLLIFFMHSGHQKRLMRYSSLGRTRSGISSYSQLLREYEAYKDKTFAVSAAGGDPGNYILVLGESASRSHVHVYGYERTTTPFIEKLAEAGNLFVFHDVIAPHSHTIPVLKKILTLARRSNGADWHEVPGIIDVAGASGYRTYWLSNQERSGILGNIAALFAGRSQSCYFHSGKEDKQKNPGTFDEDIIPQLRSVLENDEQKKFIIIHLMGSHAPYRKRYPMGHEYFTDRNGISSKAPSLDSKMIETINHYDNSILYGDFVISEIIRNAANLHQKSAVIYVSDHGEEVFDFRNFAGHAESRGSNYTAEIPFMIWVSDEYKKAHPAKIRAIRRSVQRPYSTEHFSHTMMDIMNISGKEFDGRKSIVHDNFVPRERYYAGTNYDTGEILIHAKLGAHRVDSLEKLMETKNRYPCLEVDVVFDSDKKYFDITHPPVESIGLSLDEWLENLNTHSKTVWIDFKNLNRENAQDSFTVMEYLVKKHNLNRNKLIIESEEPLLLKDFTEKGYVTSYYLPSVRYDRLPEQEKAELVRKIVEKIYASNIAALSFEPKNYAFIKQFIASKSNKTLLTWMTWRTREDADIHEDIQEIVTDPEVKFILVRHDSKYYR